MAETEDRKLMKITWLLERGGTMLATHHECGAPMFRYQGKIVCPVCDFQERQAEEPIRPTDIIKERVQKENQREIPGGSIITEKTIASGRSVSGKSMTEESPRVEIAIREKMETIASSLKEETDLQQVKHKLECIELGTRILKLLGE